MRGGEIQRLEEQCDALRNELDCLAAFASLAGAGGGTAEAPLNLEGKRLLYVGGRPKQIGQLRQFTARQGGTLLSHDGGVEDSIASLPAR